MMNEVLNSCKNAVYWYKSWCKTKKKKLVAVSGKLSRKYFLKTWNAK